MQSSLITSFHSSTPRPLVSVIMAVYNGAAYLAEAIESALNQTYSNIELIIVNDCSSDESVSIVTHYLSDGRITLFHNERNSGVAASRNRALEHAKGEFITFLDQDDIWLPRKLEIQVAVIQANPGIGLLHAGYARIDPNSALLPAYRELPAERFSDPEATVDVRDVFAEIFVTNDIQPLTTMIPREVMEVVGPFNAELPGVDDYELWLRIALRYPVGHIQTIVGYWRAHPGQQSNQGYRMLMIRLQALDQILKQYPEAESRVPRKAFRKRMHGMCAGAANYTMYYLHDYLPARDLFARALKYQLLDFPSWGKYAYCSLPTTLRDRLRKIKGLLKVGPTANHGK